MYTVRHIRIEIIHGSQHVFWVSTWVGINIRHTMLKLKNTIWLPWIISKCRVVCIIASLLIPNSYNLRRLVSKISHRLYILWLLNSNWNKTYVYLCTRSSRFSVQMCHRTRMCMVSDVESKMVDYWTELHMWKSYYVRYRQSKDEQG